MCLPAQILCVVNVARSSQMARMKDVLKDQGNVNGLAGLDNFYGSEAVGRSGDSDMLVGFDSDG